MPNIQVRNLSKGGIVKDVSALALPMPAWTGGRNVTFLDGKAMRSPIWRRVLGGLNASSGSPVRFCIARTPTTGFDEVIVGRDDASLVRYRDGSLIEASEPGFVAQGPVSSPWTGCFLGDVLYVNRPDVVPRRLELTDTTFLPLENWDATWRCGILRSFQDTLVALNVTKGAVQTPSMVKVSDVAFYGAAPGSWNALDPTTLSYESPLSQLTGPILDGLTLGDRFLIYTAHQVLEMRNDGTFSYSFQKLFNDDGILNTNCVVEIEGLHYVYGQRDIYVTDGQTKKSLAEGRIREWLYRTANVKMASRAFVQYVPQTNEIIFAHVSGDPQTAWKSPTGCNNAAVYNRTTDTWSLIDLPNVSAMTLSNVDSVLTYATCQDRTYGGTGGSYYDQEDSRNLHVVGVSAPLNTRDSATVIDGNGILLGYDFVDRGQLAYPADVVCCAPSFVERTGIALDDAASGNAPLNTDKLITGIFPEVSVSRAMTVDVSFAGTMTPSGSIKWSDPVSFDPVADYQVDTMDTGRYLAIRFVFQPFADTEVIGFDVSVVANGSR